MGMVLCLFSFMLAVIIKKVHPLTYTLDGYGAIDGLYSYAKAHPRDYDTGMKLYTRMSAELERRGCSDPVLALSVVFPELMRYHTLRNAGEILYTRVMYSCSKQYGNVSIGDFQMKVFFAETLENVIARTSYAVRQKYSAINFKGKNATLRARCARISRLCNPVTELDYLCAFIDVCTEKYGLSRVAFRKKLIVLSTAYNAGMSRSLEELETIAHIDSFPYTYGDRRAKWNYSKIALEFYERQR